MFPYVCKQIFSKLYTQVNNSRILRIKSVEFLGYFLHEHKHVKRGFQIWNSVLSAFKRLLQILVIVIEKNLWHSYISIFGIYSDSKPSRLELSYVAMKNLKILTKVLEINFMAGGFSDEVRRQKSLQSMVFCYLLSSDVYITFNK